MGTSSDTVGPTQNPRETPAVVEVLNRLRTKHNTQVRDRQAKGYAEKIEERREQKNKEYTFLLISLSLSF